ncbi:hypothetical protein [Chryseolinea lacunae]|uniref:SprT-like domain-containing protein n=1 Tax=Chryseolinea lacunae TaxID=2801331 RepID=A0ABS1KNE6_9BACT|nr:hypothetical protein [Chryseolinea lacunae]MBL0740984.1 hypothetical protein [Chryseolinea lacunae]
MEKFVRSAVALLLLAMAFSCEEPLQGPPAVVADNGARYTHINPKKDANLLSLLKLYAPAPVADGRTQSTVFDSLVFDEAVKVTNPQRGISRYTLLLPPTDNGFENVVLRETDTTVFAYRLHYQPDPEWLAQHHGVFHNQSFTGMLTLMDIDGHEQMRIFFVDGAGVKTIATTPPRTGRDCSDDAKPGIVKKPTITNGPGAGGGNTTGPPGKSSPIGTGGGGTSGGGGNGTGGGAGGGGGGGGGTGGGGKSGSNCNWHTSETTGGLVIDCPGRALIFVLRDACDGGGTFDDTNPDNNDDDPIGVLPPATLPLMRIRLDTSLTNNKKAMCIYTALGGLTTFRNIVKDFSGENSALILNYKVEDMDSVYGKTTPSSNFKTVTTAISRKLIKNSNSLLVAKTFLHEAIHAQIFATLSEIGGYKNLNKMNFPELFEAYAEAKTSKLPGPGNFAHHQVMAKKYLDLIVAGLVEFNAKSNPNSTFTPDQYRALAWQGLTKTSVFLSLPENEQKKNQKGFRRLDQQTIKLNLRLIK